MDTPSQINDQPSLRLVKPIEHTDLERAERQIRGLRDHLEAIGMLAEAAAARHALDMLTAHRT